MDPEPDAGQEAEETRAPEGLVVVREGSKEPQESVHHPAKLLRIGAMVRELLDEVRQTKTDEAGRKRLREIYDRTLDELNEVLSEDLRKEVSALTVGFGDEVPSESELRVAHAQLVGWLEGLLHGMQAAFMAQQMQARAQLEEMRRRALPGGPTPAQPVRGQPGGAEGSGGPDEDRPDYRYL